MDARASKLQTTIELVTGAALIALCLQLTIYARHLAWDSTRLAQSGDKILAYASVFWLAMLPVAAWIRHRLSDHYRKLLPWLTGAIILALVAPEGRFATLLALGYLGAVGLEPALDRLSLKARAVPWAVFTLFVGAALASVLHRHQRFGSGAWDLGCFTHSSWLASRFEPLQSTLLHDQGVHVLGDHFYPVIMLLSPIHWLGLGAVGMLVAQILITGAVAFPFYRFVARRVEHPVLQFALVFALLFSFAFQSAVYFDFHAQTLALWPLMEAVDRLDQKRFKAMLPWLVLAWFCKESMPLYVAAFGAYMVLFEPEARKLGAAIAVGGVAGLLVTVGWLQPKLLAGGPQGMIHAANYEAFGKSLPDAVVGMVKNPLRTVLVALSPIEKRMAILTTGVGAGLLAVWRPRYLVLALPTLVERFLSSKQQMWEMGYHYAAPLTLYVAVAAVDAVPRFMEHPSRWSWRLQRPAVLAGAVLLLCVLVNGFGYRHQSNFMTWNHDYFLSPAEAAAARKMVAQVPAGASVEATNHVLAHLSDRKDARFLKRSPTSDALAFSLGQDDWKPNRGNVRPQKYKTMIRRLIAEKEYRLVFSEELALLFLRGGADQPQASPSKELVEFLR
jgi:uncharacterized membrane protein